MDGPQTTPEKPSLLPVPWSSPWKQLRQDLARDLPAVGSASVLRLRELWRRNREGDLSVPGFWPQALSAWFWPLLLAVALSLLSLPLLLGRGTTPAPAVVLEQPLPVEQQLQAGRPVLLEIELEGARQVRRSFSKARQIFLAPPSFEELERRIRGRGTDSEDAIQRRLLRAREELSAQGEFDAVVVNDDLDQALLKLEGLMGLG